MNCPVSTAVGPAGWQGTSFAGCSTPVTDPATGVAPVYDLILTWYGVQTDGPMSNGVVTSDMYLTNAQQIIAYMIQSPLKYTGICLHVDSPVGNSCANQGKPSNFVGDVDMMAALINTIPAQYRVGFHVVVEQDATWQINSSQPCPGHYQYKKTTFASVNPACVGVTGESEALDKPSCAGADIDTENCCFYKSGQLCYPGVQPSHGTNPAMNCEGINPPTDSYDRCYVVHSGPGTVNGQTTPDITYEPDCCYAFGYTKPNSDCPDATLSDPAVYTRTNWANLNTACGTVPTQPSESSCPDLFSSLSTSCCYYMQYAQCAAMLGPASYSPGAALAYGPSPAGECTQGASIRSASAFPPGFDISSQTVWYGGAGEPGSAADVTSSGYPYQVAAASSDNGQLACPYKAAATAGDDNPADIAMPPGCPNNLGKVGWYCALINAKLRAMGSAQIVSMMNWDAEGNGPDGLQCSIFQFLYGLRQYGTVEDVSPEIAQGGQRVAVPWILYQNGSSGMAASADTPSDTIPCGNWAAVDINLVGDPVDASSAITTYGDMAVFQAAPEYYWFGGEDMGGVADGGKPGEGMLQSLVDAGYFGCPQSGVMKTGYDSNCGCRNTVYETYGHLTDGGIALVDLLCELYGQTAANIPDSTPAFSIEHLGGYDNPINFSTCINAQNFCANMNSDSSTMTLCGNNAKCTPRCGVANFFGGWTEECFKQFLDYFAVKYGAKSLMVYDAGFIPTAWVDTVDTMPGGIITTPNISGCAAATPMTSSAFIADQWARYGVSVTDPCPLTLAAATRYVCGDSSAQAYKVSPDPTTGLIIPQNLRCYTCSGVGTCAFLPGDAGTSSHNFQQAKVCVDSSACATWPATWAPAASGSPPGATPGMIVPPPASGSPPAATPASGSPPAATPASTPGVIVLPPAATPASGSPPAATPAATPGTIQPFVKPVVFQGPAAADATPASLQPWAIALIVIACAVVAAGVVLVVVYHERIGLYFKSLKQ